MRLMTKREFLDRLRHGLQGLPNSDIEERLMFYSEMIDDRMEEGLSETEAVAQVGSVEKVIGDIMSEIPLVRLVKEKIKPRRALKTWELILIIAGSPIWLSLLIGLVAVGISLVATIWAIDVSLWSAVAAFGGGALGGLVMFFVYLGGPAGFLFLGASILCMGFTVLSAIGCFYVTKFLGKLTVKIPTLIKYCFIRKGGEK